MPRRAKPTLKPVSYPNDVYGAGVNAIKSQQAIPLSNDAAQTAPQPPAVAPAPSVPQAGPPGQVTGPPPVTPLDAPTNRPNEHVMSGAPIGPGPGPSAVMATQPGDPVAEQLMAMLAAYPNDDLAALVNGIKAGDYNLFGTFGKH